MDVVYPSYPACGSFSACCSHFFGRRGLQVRDRAFPAFFLLPLSKQLLQCFLQSACPRKARRNVVPISGFHPVSVQETIDDNAVFKSQRMFRRCKRVVQFSVRMNMYSKKFTCSELIDGTLKRHVPLRRVGDLEMRLKRMKRCSFSQQRLSSRKRTLVGIVRAHF